MSRRYEGREALVLGFGRSGEAAAVLLAREGAQLTLYDRDPARLAACTLPAHVTASLPDLAGFDLVVASPGIPVDPGAGAIPEVDLAARHACAPFIGITGTNGKSTTTVLIGEMLRASGLRPGVGGNLGTPLCALVGDAFDWIVAELSSFQLEHARELRARVSVLLNLAPDHLDRHGSLSAYGAAKARLAELQGDGDVCIANADDPWATETARASRARVVPFSKTRKVDGGFACDGRFVCPLPAGPALELPTSALSPACRAHLDNALAASLAAAAAGASETGIGSVLERFEGLPHRMQSICTRAGVAYIDDSKATNPAATAASVGAFERPVVWLAGGANKGLDFAPLAAIAPQVFRAIAFGASAHAIAAALGDTIDIEVVPDLEAAMARASGVARPGDAVVLSPACASFDQFRSFEERGERFAALAREIPE